MSGPWISSPIMDNGLINLNFRTRRLNTAPRSGHSHHRHRLQQTHELHSATNNGLKYGFSNGHNTLHDQATHEARVRSQFMAAKLRYLKVKKKPTPSVESEW